MGPCARVRESDAAEGSQFVILSKSNSRLFLEYSPLKTCVVYFDIS